MQTAFFLFFLLLLAGCQPPSNHSKAPMFDPGLQTNSGAQVLNAIVVNESGGLRISRAFLSNPEGNIISPANAVRVGDTVFLNLVIAQGWVAENGLVSLGASQSIFTNEGELVTSSPDLFVPAYAVKVAEAGNVQLKTVIINNPEKKSFLVQYRLWDKKGNGEVRGHYRLHLIENMGN